MYRSLTNIIDKQLSGGRCVRGYSAGDWRNDKVLNEDPSDHSGDNSAR